MGKDGYASLEVHYSVVDVSDSKGNPWKLQMAEIPEGYKVEGPVCQPFKLLASLRNDGKTLVMTKYFPPRLRDKLNPKYKKTFWGIKKWNNPPRQLNDIYVRKAIGDEEKFKELEEIREEKQKIEHIDYQESMKPENRKKWEELVIKEMHAHDKCYDTGAARLRLGRISEGSVRAMNENEDLKKLLADWDWRQDNGGEHRLRPNLVSLEGLLS